MNRETRMEWFKFHAEDVVQKHKNFRRCMDKSDSLRAIVGLKLLLLLMRLGSGDMQHIMDDVL
jgi:hypothetical protein